MRIALLLVLWLVSISSAPACGETTELGCKLDARVSHYSLAAKGLAEILFCALPSSSISRSALSGERTERPSSGM